MTKFLRHVVLSKFRDGINTEKVKEIENAFCAIMRPHLEKGLVIDYWAES